MTAASEPRQRPAKPGAALWRTEGFTVETNGEHVGIVEGPIRISGLSRPAALAVRLGGSTKRVVLVPVTEIVEVDVEAHTVSLRRPPAQDG